jgi:hypothetical protein
MCVAGASSENDPTDQGDREYAKEESCMSFAHIIGAGRLCFPEWYTLSIARRVKRGGGWFKFNDLLPSF